MFGYSGEKMINNEFRTKSLTFTIKNVSVDEKKNLGFVSGLASTFGNKDRDGDVIEKGAFTKSLNDMRANNKVIPVLLAHRFDKQVGGIPASNLTETEEGLNVNEMMLDLNLQRSQDTHSLMKNGFLTTFSIGFSIPDGGFERTKDGLKITEIELFEISIVPVPANPLAVMTDVKAVSPLKSFPIAPDDTPWSGSQARKDIQEATGSTDSPSASYKSGFLWYDAGNADDFGAYKMPFVAKVGGSLKIVPRGIFAAAAAMQGARGGVSIPSSDRGAVRAKIVAIYKKLGRDSPFSDHESDHDDDDDKKALHDDDDDKALHDDDNDRNKSRNLLLKSLQDTVTMAKLINQDILN